MGKFFVCNTGTTYVKQYKMYQKDGNAFKWNNFCVQNTQEQGNINYTI